MWCENPDAGVTTSEEHPRRGLPSNGEPKDAGHHLLLFGECEMIYVHPATGLKVRILSVKKYVTSMDVYGNSVRFEAGSELQTETGQSCQVFSDGLEARVYTEAGPVSVYRCD